ncbi:MAG: hypothetical protein HY784_02630 [Chloroflexi bacterium]|nr:hypothetical protein [Chloroflexota bacterium]
MSTLRFPRLAHLFPCRRPRNGVKLTVCHGTSPLSRVQREMLATVVSAELRCHY